MVEIVTAPPKSQQVADIIRTGIRDGDLVPGTRLESVRKLADRFAVGRQVIHSAFQILEREDLILSEKGSGTYVKSPAKRIVKKRFALLTEFTRDNIEGYFESLNSVFSRSKCLYIPLAGIEKSNLEMLLEQEPDVLMVDIHYQYQPEFKKLIDKARKRVAVCHVHRGEQPLRDVTPAILIDGQSIYEQAFEYLFGKGHETILLLKYSPMTPLVEKQVKNAAHSLGLDYPSPRFKFIAMDAHDNYDSAIRSLFKSNAPTAVLGASDWLTHYFLQRLKTLFSAAPQLEAIGSFDTQWSKQPETEFHSFNMNFESMWQAVIEKYVNRNPADFNEVIWVKPKFIERQVSIPLAV